MRRCTSLNAKPFWRVCIDSSLNLIVPASISGFFYVRVIQNLWSQEKRVERNRVLSISFITSWFMWVLLWTPKLIMGFIQVDQKPVEYSAGRLGNMILAYLVPTETIIQILYSQLNPFIFVVLLKKVHDYHKNVWTLLKKSLLWKKHVDDTKGTQAKESVTQPEEFGYRCIRKSNDPNLLIKVFVFTSASLALLLLTTATVNTMVCNSSGNELKFLSNKSSETQHLVKSIKRIVINVGGLISVQYLSSNKIHAIFPQREHFFCEI